VGVDQPALDQGVGGGQVGGDDAVKAAAGPLAVIVLQPGGLLVYSTCTLLPEENQNQVRAFMERNPEFSLDMDVSWLPEALRDQVADGMLQLLPHRHKGMDGFFIARMRRKA